MNAILQETLPELHDFVANQAEVDAVLPEEERSYQAELVRDVLGQESLKPSVEKQLFAEYTEGVASHLGA